MFIFRPLGITIAFRQDRKHRDQNKNQKNRLFFQNSKEHAMKFLIKFMFFLAFIFLLISANNGNAIKSIPGSYPEQLTQAFPAQTSGHIYQDFSSRKPAE